MDDLSRLPGASWFLGSRLNFTENLLEHRGDGAALILRRVDGLRREIPYQQLRWKVAETASALKEAGVKPGDRVAAYTPNIVEAVVAMLATLSLGGLWSSCGTELGVSAVVDRLGQRGPRILFTGDGYI